MLHRRLARVSMVMGALALVALGGWFLDGCAPPGKPVLLVGHYGSLTGDNATFGKSTDEGARMAIDEVDSAGGVAGVAISLITYDDQSKPDEAQTAVKRLVSQDGVIAVLGEVASSRSLAAAPVCQGAGVPMISPSSTNPKVTQTGDYIFRVCFIDPFQGRVMAKFASEQLRLKKVAILKDLKSDYSVGLTDFFTQSFSAGGGQIPVVQTYSSGDQDFRAQLTAIKARNPDGIYIPGYYTEVGLIARQARELGITVPLFGGDGWESEQLTKIGGEALDGCYFSTHQSMDNPAPLVQDFVKHYAAKYQGKAPDALAALGYDAARVLVAALERVSKEDPEAFKALQAKDSTTPARKAAQRKLRDFIAGTTNFEGVSGRISLDADRNAIKSAVVLRIQGGKFSYSATVAP